MQKGKLFYHTKRRPRSLKLCYPIFLMTIRDFEALIYYYSLGHSGYFLVEDEELT